MKTLKDHAINLSQIHELEGEEGQFEYLIDIGKREESFSDKDKNDDNKMSGCLAQVWIKRSLKDNKNYFEGDSDALIVKGLVKILARAFSGLSSQEIKEIRHDVVNELGLGPSLSARRQVGMMAMIDHIKIISKAKWLLLIILKKLFKTNSIYQLIVVFIVFGISGTLSVYVSEPILNLFDYKAHISNNFLQIVIRILIIFPIYQIILLAVGTAFGEFKYFWNFGKRFWQKFKK